MKTVNTVISKLCTGVFAAALALASIHTANAEEVKIVDVLRIRVPTANVDITDDGCSLYVNLEVWRDAEVNVVCVDKDNREEVLNMDLPLVDHQLEIPLANVPLGTYEVTISNGVSTLIITVEKIDETTDIYYDPFAAVERPPRR